MAHQTGPTSIQGKAKSSRNAERHGLTNFKPVVTEADRPEFLQMCLCLQRSIQPSTYLQQVAFERLVNACWNMQRALKLENQLREALGDADPMACAEQIQLAELYHRYYVRFEGSYRAALRELERLQKLDLRNAMHLGDAAKPLGELHDVQEFQRFAKRNGVEAARLAAGATQPAQATGADPAAKAAANPQPSSNQHAAKRNPAPAPPTARNAACPCGSGKKYKRCCGVDAPPVLFAA